MGGEKPSGMHTQIQVSRMSFLSDNLAGRFCYTQFELHPKRGAERAKARAAAALQG